MKILFVFHHGGITGASLALYSTIEWLSENTTFEMSFLLRENGIVGEMVSKYGKVYNWEEEEYKQLNILSRIKRKIFPIKTKTQILIDEIEKQNFDIIYFNTIICSKIIHQFAKLHSVKIWHIHELELAINYYGIKHLNAVSNISKVIANSRSTELALLKFGFNKNIISVVYPFINCHKITESLNPQVQRHDFNIPENAFIIGTSGTVMDRKGVDSFISLSVMIDKLLPNNEFYYTWVGGYTNKQKIMFDHDLLKSGKSDRVLFLGEHKNPYPLYNLFDVFVSTSKEESFGLSALESAYLSKPLLCFANTGGIEEIVRDSKNIVVPYLDIYELAKNIIVLYNDKLLRKTQGESAKKNSEQFDVNVIMPQLTDFLKKSI